MWTFEISKGELSHPADPIGYRFSAYSGAPGHIDNPDDEALADEGPLPEGKYAIGAPHTSSECGPYAMMLLPDPANDMHGRSGFLIHGDSITHPGMASKGCIVTTREAREAIYNSGDHELIVIA